MKLIADLHTHTIASGHAISTLGEMVAEAKHMGYKALATTDHANTMPGSPAPYYFTNLLRQPDVDEDGFLLLKGIEANILSPDGKTDIPENLAGEFDWIVASVHAHLLEESFGRKTPTDMWLKIAENPVVDMIGHSEMQTLLYDYDAVTKVFCECNKVVEMNAGSALARPGNEENLKKLAMACMKNGTKIAVTSDAHSVYQMHNLDDVLAMLREIDFPQELVINASMERLLAELALHNKPIAKRIAGLV